MFCKNKKGKTCCGNTERFAKNAEARKKTIEHLQLMKVSETTGGIIMPNKAYWNQMEEIMKFTDAMGSALGAEAYGESDKKQIDAIIAEAQERKGKAPEAPMELITLSGLASEFKDVAKETRANYCNAKTEEEKQEILDEVLECTSDFFSFLAEEAAEVFGDAKKRLREAAKENAWEDEAW